MITHVLGDVAVLLRRSLHHIVPSLDTVITTTLMQRRLAGGGRARRPGHGFRAEAGVLGWLAVAGSLVLLTPALTRIAVIPGLTAKSADGASAFSYLLILLPFVSSALSSLPPHDVLRPS
jgi:hypothetical protein